MTSERSRTFDSGDRARATLPSRAQLLLLVECAEQRELTSGEAYLLRLGVTHLASQVDAAAAERDAVVRDDSPLSVRCGYCKAPVGRSCVSRTAGAPLLTPHTARLDALRRRLEMAS